VEEIRAEAIVIAAQIACRVSSAVLLYAKSTSEYSQHHQPADSVQDGSARPSAVSCQSINFIVESRNLSF
jgi:hypothetical protein